jgi:hypothetical protein
VHPSHSLANDLIKKPDSKENLASEEGDEKLFVDLRKGYASPNLSTSYIVESRAKSLAKTKCTGKIMLFPPEFKG